MFSNGFVRPYSFQLEILLYSKMRRNAACYSKRLCWTFV